MYLEALIFAIILGYLLKGSLKNLDSTKIKGLYLVFIAFFIEFLIVILITKNLLIKGSITFILDLIMYVLLILFTYLNRRSIPIIIIAIGFMLNALPIFLNSGAMPVDVNATVKAGLYPSVEDAKIAHEGLYTIIDSNTKLWFLGDIIPKTFLRRVVLSIGDIVIGIGLMLFVVTGMKNIDFNIKSYVNR
jgi:hypothetical protein